MANKTIRFKQDADLEIQGALRLQGSITATNKYTPTNDYDIATKKYVDEHSSKATTYTVNIPVSDWKSNGLSQYDVNHYYSQSVEVKGISREDAPIVLVVPGDTKAANDNILTSYECVSRITTENNSITLYADHNEPTSDFTIILKVV